MRNDLDQAIALLKKEDPASVQAAIEILQGTVFSFSMKVCGHREDAEDTMQDVFVSSLPHLAKIDDSRALSVWLYTAARNRCWRNRKRHSYQRSVALEDLMPNEAELAELLAAANSPTLGPEEQTLHQEDHRMVHAAVLELPPQYRMVLVLHDMEELDTDEVAAVLGIKPGTVRVRLHRARLLLRQEMDKKLRGRRQMAQARKANHPARPRRGPACSEIFANLSEYMDGRLEPKTCDQMKTHIEACPACLAFIRDLKAAIDRSRAIEMPMDGEMGRSLRRMLAEEYLRLLKNGENLARR
jgi:RNA polymerase sigma-70 factor (ECF subfamily)